MQFAALSAVKGPPPGNDDTDEGKQKKSGSSGIHLNPLPEPSAPPAPLASSVAKSESAVGITAGVARAIEHQECSICFDGLCLRPAACMCDSTGKRVCMHNFHHACLSEMRSKACPICRANFATLEVMPNPMKDAAAWFRFVDTDHSGSLTYDEILEGLHSQLPLDYQQIEVHVDSLFGKWDTDKNGHISFKEFSDPKDGLLKYLMENFKLLEIPPPPTIAKDKSGWFQYWDEDKSGTLDKSEICRALIKTFRLQERDVSGIASMLDAVWPIFDADNSGVIEMHEFVAPDNLADTIIATLG